MKKIEESAEVHLKQKDYKEALWEYEHCISYIRNYFPAFSARHARATIKYATILLKISSFVSDRRRVLHCLYMAKESCDDCIQLGVTDHLAQVSTNKGNTILKGHHNQTIVHPALIIIGITLNNKCVVIVSY